MNDQIPTKSPDQPAVYSSTEQFKRHTAYKLRIGSISEGKQIIDGDRLKFLEIENKQVSRVNVIANIIDKFVQDGEKKYASLTIDDASGQIRVKVFGDDIEKFSEFQQGDTILTIGLLRSWNEEVYIIPEIIKKKPSQYLLIRKLEIESDQPKKIEKETLIELKDKIIQMVKDAEKDQGIDIDKLILELKEPPDIINQEIKKLLEDGQAYEPRPGKLRYLG